jgi:hypothetical protein
MGVLLPALPLRHSTTLILRTQPQLYRNLPQPPQRTERSRCKPEVHSREQRRVPRVPGLGGLGLTECDREVGGFAEEGGAGCALIRVRISQRPHYATVASCTQLTVISIRRDADFIANAPGGEAISLAVSYAHAAQFRAAEYQPFVVNGN